MNNRPATWLLMLISFSMAWQCASAYPIERDIVKVAPITGQFEPDSLPGLITGRRILDSLNETLELVRAGVPKAAQPGLVNLDRELRQLARGRHAGSALPPDYSSAGQLWLPVHAELLKVSLDAPDLRLRPSRSGAGGQIGNLTARAQRIDWLPLQTTANRAEASLALLVGGPDSLVRAQRLLEAAIQGVRSRLVLLDRPLIQAYYHVETALTKAPSWNATLRRQMRDSAESLSSTPRFAKLARRIQAQADRIRPDFRKLHALALALRRQIEAETEGSRE